MDVQQTPSPAPNDWYGKLFLYLRNVLKMFLDRLKKTQVSFDIYNVDAKELPRILEQGRYSRIEVRSQLLTSLILI